MNAPIKPTHAMSTSDPLVPDVKAEASSRSLFDQLPAFANSTPIADLGAAGSSAPGSIGDAVASAGNWWTGLSSQAQMGVLAGGALVLLASLYFMFKK
jgi:hypothetical protein